MTNYILLNNKTLIYSADLSTSMTPGNDRNISINRTEDKDLYQLSYDINFIVTHVNMDGDTPLIVYIDPYSINSLIKLMELFNFMNFEIYDQVDLDPKLEHYIAENPERVKFYFEPKEKKEQYSPDMFSKRYDGHKNKYLISTLTDVSIREKINSHDPEIQKNLHLEKEKIIAINSDKNILIASAFNGKRSFLKFRPFHIHKNIPGRNTNFTFFNGTPILPIFSGKKSSDCRMVVSDYTDIIDWDSEKVTMIINHWNKQTREYLALNPFNGRKEPLPNQLGNYFEISVLFMILKDYYLSINHIDPTAHDVYNLYSRFIIDDIDEDDARCGR